MYSLLLFIQPLKELARISYAYRTPILMMSVVVATSFAILLLSSTEARQLAGRWVKYVGLAFLAYGFQYTFRLVGWLIRDSSLLPVNLQGQSVDLVKITCDFFANVGSGANNLFFLAAAFVLLNRRTPFLRPRIFIAIVTVTASLTTAANLIFVETGSSWAAAVTRLPDALFSAFCLGLFGYAIRRNFLTQQRKTESILTSGRERSDRMRIQFSRHFWATVVTLITVFYGLIQLIYAANPVWAKYDETSIQRVISRANYGPKPRDPVAFLDSALFAVALPMKMLLFVPPFYLFFMLVIAAHDFRKVLRVVTEQKKSYLSSDGIVQAIADSISATLVEVFIKLPGTAPKSAWRISWPRDDSDSFILLEPENKVDPRLLKVLNGTADIPLHYSGETKRQIDTSLPPNSDFPPPMLPVRFHGAVIGCLKAEFHKPRSFTYAAMQQLNSMADLLGPALQDYRALASIDQLSGRFARLQVQKPGAEFNATTREMGSILNDVLSPLGLGLLLEAGFRSNHILEPNKGEIGHLLEGQSVRYEVEDLTTTVIRTDIGEVKVYKNQLIASDRDDPLSTLPLGNVVLILPSEHDEINRPTLGDYSLHRRTIASQTADGFLDLVRDHLGYELKTLSVALNAEALTQDAWLAGIKELRKKVELAWVGVTQTGVARILGDADAEEIIPKLSDEQRKVLEAKSLSCVPYQDESTQTHHVLRIDLEKSKHQLWFGVAREGFGLELDFPSPWKSFLDDLSEITDSALASLFEIQKSKETLARLAEDQGITNIAITSGHLMHELSNKVDDQQLPAQSLWNAVERGGILMDANQRAQMKAILNSTMVMKNLMAVLSKATKPDDRGVFALRDVVTRATEYYEQINLKDIKFRNRVKEDLWINIPFNVARFAIANLIGNAKDAIEERMKEMEPDYVGQIRIEARLDGEYVVCYVIDNGPGIPEELVDRLYQLGSPKPGHNGWGLYLTNRSLSENRGEIKLLESCRGSTKFSLRFPKAESP